VRGRLGLSRTYFDFLLLPGRASNDVGQFSIFSFIWGYRNRAGENLYPLLLLSPNSFYPSFQEYLNLSPTFALIL